MDNLSTYFLYIGLLFVMTIILATKKLVFNPVEYDLIDSRNRIEIQDILILLILTILIGFRFDVGVDWISYKNYFDDFDLYKDYSFEDQRMEIGYYYLNYLIYSLGGSSTVVFGLASLISWLFIFKSFPTKLLPLTIFFLFYDGYFFWSMNGVRQFIAIAIFAYSIHFIRRKDLKKYLLFIFLASLFHQSALILLLLYFLPFEKMYNQKFWIIAFILSLVFSQSVFIINGFRSIFEIGAQQIPLLSSYVHYFDSKYYEAGQMDGSGMGYLFSLAVSLLLLVFSKRIITSYPSAKIYFVLFFIGITVLNLFFMFGIVSRFTRYFVFLKAFLLALFVYHEYKKKQYNILGVGLIILCFLIFLSEMYNSANKCCPYQFSPFVE